MDVFDLLTMVGGLCLFLFGMSIMGTALERSAGGKLRSLLEKLTSNKLMGLLTGLGVTAVIQSSSATTVMVVGFVNSGLMTLRQAINVIMGANIGTTITSWILSLAGIDSGNIFIELLKPSSFTPILALIGIIFYMFCKNGKKKDVGLIFLGFSTLMFGMETMSSAVSGLRDVPAFRNVFLLFQNPILGVLAGAVLTAIIQSSSASVGILQALTTTGQVSYGAAVPIIMGQNIGTCVTALISAVGANKNAKRAAMVHFSFNVIGTTVWLTVFCVLKAILSPVILTKQATFFGIAVLHSVFNLLCTILLLPMSDFLETLAKHLIPDAKQPEKMSELDTRLLTTPPIALKRCYEVTEDMAQTAVLSMKNAIHTLYEYSPKLAEMIREQEDKTDHYEDILGTYLVQLSTKQISENDSAEAAKLLKIIGDYERIADHAVNILESAEEMRQKGFEFTDEAKSELSVLTAAVCEILDLTLSAFLNNDLENAAMVEPLEQVIDQLKEQMRTNHIIRLQQGSCSIGAGFVLSDLLTNLERTSDHCSNIAGCIIDMEHHEMNIHESLRAVKSSSEDFKVKFELFAAKYSFNTKKEQA